MSRIFLSHSNKDLFATVAIADWLKSEGWDDVFIDVDLLQGIPPGERWEAELYRHASNCEAVLFLVSPNWLASDWCRREYELAQKLNKRPFILLIEEISIEGLPKYLKDVHQAVQLKAGKDHIIFNPRKPVTQEEGCVTFSAEGLARLKSGLARAGLDPKFFPWPPLAEPNRAPYRGLEPLEAKDAGVFFGRDAPVIEALDALRGLSEAAPPRLFVILGASGAGKSSFLRAGLLPRLSQDSAHYLSLPPIRPERAALRGANGLVAALSSAAEKARLPLSRAQILETAEAEELRPLLRQLSNGSAERRIVFAIDQAEELFRSLGAAEGQRLLELLGDLAKSDDPPVVILFAIRSDSYAALQQAVPLAGLSQKTFSLQPMPRGAYQTVIERPGQRLEQAGRKFAIDPALTNSLLEDVERGSGDALPLLAFTLEQLYRDHVGAGRVSLDDYKKFGGLKGVIEAALARVFEAADKDAQIPKDEAERMALLRRGLIPWLAGIDPETKTQRRNVARSSQIPMEARPLIDLLVEQRLLTMDVDPASGETTIEPAHEALLRQWGILKGWLDEDFGLLATLEGVQRAARDWDRNNRSDDWLAHFGERLSDAYSLDIRSDIGGRLELADHDYLAACQNREQSREKETQDQKKRLLDATQKMIVAQRHRARIAIYGSSIAVISSVIVAVFLANYVSQSTEKLHLRAENVRIQEDNLKRKLEQARVEMEKEAIGRESVRSKISEQLLAANLQLESSTNQSRSSTEAFAHVLAALRLDLQQDRNPGVQITHALKIAVSNISSDAYDTPQHVDRLHSEQIFEVGPNGGVVADGRKLLFIPISVSNVISLDMPGTVTSLAASTEYVVAGLESGRIVVCSSDGSRIIGSFIISTERSIVGLGIVSNELAALDAGGGVHILNITTMHEHFVVASQLVSILSASSDAGLLVGSLKTEKGITAVVVDLKHDLKFKTIRSTDGEFLGRARFSGDGRLLALLMKDRSGESVQIIDPKRDYFVRKLSMRWSPYTQDNFGVRDIVFSHDSNSIDIFALSGIYNSWDIDGDSPIIERTGAASILRIGPGPVSEFGSIFLGLDAGGRYFVNGTGWLTLALSGCRKAAWSIDQNLKPIEMEGLYYCFELAKKRDTFKLDTLSTRNDSGFDTFFAAAEADRLLGEPDPFEPWFRPPPPEINALSRQAFELEFGLKDRRKDTEAARRIYELAAQEGEAYAWLGLSRLLRTQNPEDPKIAEYVERARAGGIAEASNSLAFQNERGELRPKNMQAAITLYQEALDRGDHFFAPFNLARLATQTDPTRRGKLLRLSVASGNPFAAKELANNIERFEIPALDDGEKLRLMRYASRYDPGAALQLAAALEAATQTDQIARREAGELRLRAARAGNAEALTELGRSILERDPPQPKLAAEIFRRAVSAGERLAAKEIAHLLQENGASPEEIRHWYRVGGDFGSASLIRPPRPDRGNGGPPPSKEIKQ